jgi:hypothetical protein
MKSYKVAVMATGESNWSYNGQRFATRNEAQAAGDDLSSRWSAVEKFEVQKSNDPVNYKWENGQAISVKASAPAETPATVEPVPAPAETPAPVEPVPAPAETPIPSENPVSGEGSIVPEIVTPTPDLKPVRRKRAAKPKPAKKGRTFSDGSSMKGLYDRWTPDNPY